MPVKKLLHLAACKIPYEYLNFADPTEKQVINREMSQYIRPTRFSRSTNRLNRNRPLGSLCNCKLHLTEEKAAKWEDGECLCYYGLIRNDQMEQFWATENDYEFLGDWYEFP